jgi:type III restriction enzyme
MNRATHDLRQRLSLRDPQTESLEILARVADALPLKKGTDVAAALSAVQAICPKVEDFERAFPSLTFALATGVGKTRLMGAFIAYLHRVKGVRNFFVLAPNLTIYEKLKKDFDPGYERYVFTGVGEFARSRPVVITGENYQSHLSVDRYSAAQRQLGLGYEEVRINVFNIGKISAETRGGNSPRMKRMSEYLGQSYFEHLVAQPDLVLLMDESHRYRAERGMAVLNELNMDFAPVRREIRWALFEYNA